MTSIRPEIHRWLRESDEASLGELWAAADALRHSHVGDSVHLRGLVEISSFCMRSCTYCGLRAPRDSRRYRMSDDEILSSARQAAAFGYGTVVLQSGEDPAFTADRVYALIRRIKEETGLAITLSLGEREDPELAAWRAAGADRYLLRFETSNRALFRRIHPRPLRGGRDRIQMLRRLRELGYEVGSGVMVGIPGQTYADLARDLELFAELRLHMIGVGPFLPHPETPMGRQRRPAPPDQVPNSEQMTHKVLALTRLARPDANLPSTTALATVNPEGGRELGLQRGANVIMPNVTPMALRACYDIYPAKSCVGEDPEAYDRLLRRHLAALGRPVGVGPGPSPSYRAA